MLRSFAERMLRSFAERILRSFAERILRMATPIFAGLATVSCVAAVFVQPGIEAAWASHYVPLIVIAILFPSASVGWMVAIRGGLMSCHSPSH
jgi:cytochrome d ubiquinol oxidase subunit II